MLPSDLINKSVDGIDAGIFEFYHNIIIMLHCIYFSHTSICLIADLHKDKKLPEIKFTHLSSNRGLRIEATYPVTAAVVKN